MTTFEVHIKSLLCYNLNYYKNISIYIKGKNKGIEKKHIGYNERQEYKNWP